MAPNPNICTCKGYWDNCTYCRALEGKGKPESSGTAEPAGEPVRDGSGQE